ncbi:magnesium protoporphyrin IX methyltransferase [Thiorhodospira sibirica]|uniref:magnesium protoporphyrin IX methyltransferase n=1 Tax=Thiorhodospira sibirica TaxID=154347 RepID=UPI00022C39D7|nr:magnesium protoporphyrin IX methyltransferase [Thiorhodospira sibirica]
MAKGSYEKRRGQIENYFDRTAAKAWERLTSNAPVSRVRATVRAGRDEMRATLLSWLPEDLNGRRVLDAGCGTGAFAFEAARRGAEVVAIDLSPTLVDLARERMPKDLGPGSIDFRVGDMYDPHLGDFDHVVAMDSLIHYQVHDTVSVLAGLAANTRHSMVFTFAPKTPLLAVMHVSGRLFPRGDRSPSIVPVAEKKLRTLITEESRMGGWRIERTQRIQRGFYTSQALEIVRLSTTPP